MGGLRSRAGWRSASAVTEVFGEGTRKTATMIVERLVGIAVQSESAHAVAQVPKWLQQPSQAFPFGS
jgi:hypothetical protein